MRKINKYLFIILSIIGVITSVIISKNTVIFLKNISILLTLSMPYIFTKITKIKLNQLSILMWFIFVFMSHYLGVTLLFYNKYIFYDKITHALSGIISSYIALEIIKYNKIKSKNIIFLFLISFTWMIAGMWETFEYICNILVGGDAQRVVKTGVNDTMQDMIVAFLTSLSFALFTLKRKIIK